MSSQLHQLIKISVYIQRSLLSTIRNLFLNTFGHVRLCSEKRSYIKYPAEGTPPPKSAAGVAEKMQQLRERQRQRTHPTDSKEQQK